MKRALTAICSAVLVLNFLAAAGCRDKKREENEVKKTEYSALYKNEEGKSAPISGAALYKASYGYTGCEEQGYNGFYYQYLKNGAYGDMTAEKGKWKGGGASMEGGVLQAAETASAVRTFTAPETGAARVAGNPRLTAGTTAGIKISLDGTSVWETEISDGTGSWHSAEIVLQKGQNLRFEVSGDAAVYWNPAVDYTMSEEESLHHAPDGFYGDVHPFYDEKTETLYMYYLSTGRQTTHPAEQFASLLTTSGNFIRYEETSLYKDEKNPPEQDLYFALGVYEDKDGNYRSSYGKGNYAGGSVSKDLLTWSNGAEPYIDETDGLFKYTWRAYFDSDVYSGRDPDIFYDKESGNYYCIVMNYYSASTDKGSKGLALYTADEKGVFSAKAEKLLDFTGRGDPECPQLKKIGGRWYLFYSVYGTGTAGGVGRFSYRVGDKGAAPDKVDWNNKAEYALDGGDLHAAQLCEVGDRYYMYGWINSIPHANVWGGSLNLAREVYQKEDGRLGSRCDEYLTGLLNKGKVAEFRKENTVLSGMSVSNGTFTASAKTATAKIDGKYGRSLLFAEITLPAGAAYAGLSLSENGIDYHIVVFRREGKAYLAVTDDLDNPLGGVWIEIGDAAQTRFKLKAAADGNFIEAFINDEYSLTANTLLSGKGYDVGISAGGIGAEVSKTEICKLADYRNIFD